MKAVKQNLSHETTMKKCCINASTLPSLDIPRLVAVYKAEIVSISLLHGISLREKLPIKTNCNALPSR